MEAPLFCLMVSLAGGWVLKVSVNPGRKERRKEGKSWASDTGTSHAGAREGGGVRATGQKPTEPPRSTAVLAVEPDTSRQRRTFKVTDGPPANADHDLLLRALCQIRAWEPGHPQTPLPLPPASKPPISLPRHCLLAHPSLPSVTAPASHPLSPAGLLQLSTKSSCLLITCLFNLCFILTLN